MNDKQEKQAIVSSAPYVTSTVISYGAHRIISEQAHARKNGHSPELDTGRASELAAASECYAALAKIQLLMGQDEDAILEAMKVVPPMWPWGGAQWRPERRPAANLAKAGGLAASAIDTITFEARTVFGL